MCSKPHTLYYTTRSCKPLSVVNDTYQELSTKSNTQKQSEEDHIKTVPEGFERHIYDGIKWKFFLRNAENKEELINIIVKFIKFNRGQQLINSLFIVTTTDKIYIFQEG